MNQPVNPENAATPETEEQARNAHQLARLNKLRKIEELGVDPWGHDFPNRQWNADVRARAGEVKFQLADGKQLDLPDFTVEPAVDYRQWKSQLKPSRVSPLT